MTPATLEPVVLWTLMLGGPALYVWARVSRRLPRRVRPVLIIVGLGYFAVMQGAAALGHHDVAATLAGASELTALAVAALLAPLLELLVAPERTRSTAVTVEDLDPDAAKLFVDATEAGISPAKAIQLAVQYDDQLRRVRSEVRYLDPPTDPIPPGGGK